MRWLEKTPQRYDAGLRVLTLGRVAALHSAVAEAAATKASGRVLEIGCGTGAVTARLLERGASVTAIDQSPEMLEQARLRLDSGTSTPVEWLEQTASEIDRLPKQAYDSVVLCLCLSDMGRSERAFVLRESALRLARGGQLIVGDEVRAPRGWRRAMQLVMRIPQAGLGWLLVGSLSAPLPDLPGEIRAAGLHITHTQAWMMGSLQLVVAERCA
jgi:demethylmenaquinone methyltransferase/2-methoxy-6-polyprenyl-1,4-benzoquinol methylase